MPFEMHLGPDALLRCRFAISPLWETQNAVRLLRRPEQWGHHLPWLRENAATARGLGLEPLWLLMPSRGYTPDFLTPPPGGPLAPFGQEIAAVRGTDPVLARREIARALEDTPGAADSALGRELLDDPAAAVRLLADASAAAWSALVAPYWARLRRQLEADIAFHTRRLADGGLAALFDGLHPQLLWSDGALTVRRPHKYDHLRTLGGDGLTLIPSFFIWPSVAGGVELPWPATVVYPARGIGTLWSSASTSDTPEALVRLLGANRAAVLAALDEPASTTALAGRLGLAPSSVSAHLSRLRDAGLLSSYRVRHQVRYERTPLGTALASGGE